MPETEFAPKAGLTPGTKSNQEKAEIWLTLDSRIFGGIETHVLELAFGLIQFGAKVRVVLLSQYPEQPITEKLARRDIAFNFVAELSGLDHKAGQLSHFRNAVKKHQPALVHAHGYKASVVTRLASLHCKCTTQITTYHAGETPSGLVRLYDLADRYTAFLSDNCFAVSQAIANKVPRHCVVLNNFIQLPDMPQKFGHNIAFVGRLSIEKAPDRFISLAQRFTDQHFHLYGSGPMETELSQNKANNITFHGHIKEMEQIWPDVTLLVIPSRFEGLPMAALEAMGRGIPVIATDVGALDTLIQHNKNGWLGSSIEELGGYLSNWLAMTEGQQHHFRIQARAAVKSGFSSEAVIPAYLDLIN